MENGLNFSNMVKTIQTLSAPAINNLIIYYFCTLNFYKQGKYDFTRN